MKPPAFQFYADDFIGGTVDMKAEEVGAYIRLLCHQWTRGGLVNDLSRLVIVTGCNEATTSHVLTKFEPCNDGLLRNIRLEVVRGANEEWREKSRAGGKASAKSRVGNSDWARKMIDKRTKNEPQDEPSGEPLTNSPSPSPSPKETPTPLAAPAPQGDLVLDNPHPLLETKPPELQVRIGRLLHRRPNTKWHPKELKALKSIGEPDESDLQMLEGYYSARIPSDKDYRRQTLQVLLNNFNGELDRARNFKAPSCF